MTLIQLRGQMACYCEKGANNCEGYGNVAEFSGAYFLVPVLSRSILTSDDERSEINPCSLYQGAVDF